jgi:hypothetical protein
MEGTEDPANLHLKAYDDADRLLRGKDPCLSSYPPTRALLTGKRRQGPQEGGPLRGRGSADRQSDASSAHWANTGEASPSTLAGTSVITPARIST